MIATVRSEVSVNESGLDVAFELGKKDWKLAMTTGFGVKPWLRTVAGADLVAVAQAMGAGRQRFGLSPGARVVSCDEAGRDGCWIHRALQSLGVENRVNASALGRAGIRNALAAANDPGRWALWRWRASC